MVLCEHLHLLELFSERFTGKLIHLRRRRFTLDIINVHILGLSIQMLWARQRHQSISQVIAFCGRSQDLRNSSSHYETFQFEIISKQIDLKSPYFNGLGMNLVELRHFLFAVGFRGLEDILKVFVGLLQIAFLRFQLSYLFSEEYNVDIQVRMIQLTATKASASIWEEK